MAVDDLVKTEGDRRFHEVHRTEPPSSKKYQSLQALDTEKANLYLADMI